MLGNDGHIVPPDSDSLRGHVNNFVGGHLEF